MPQRQPKRNAHRKPKPKPGQPPIVRAFAARLRELRRSRGMTQAELALEARVTAAYVWRLESGAIAPGIDLVDRLAKALSATPGELLPVTEPPDADAALRELARARFESLLSAADRETLLMLNPLLARLSEADRRR